MRIPILCLAFLLALPALAEDAPQSVDPVELFQQGQQALASGDNPKALEIFRRVSALLPEDDVVLSAVAQTLVNLGQQDEAREVYRRAARLAAGYGARDRLSIYHQSLVVLATQYPEELQSARVAASALPDTPAAQQALAEFRPLSQQIVNLMAMGKLAEARPVIEQTLAVARQGFGKDHPSTLWALNSLADVRRVQGDARRALPLYEQAVKGCARRFGLDFPDCLTYRNNQATCLRELGRVKQAEKLLEAVWRASQKALGASHLLTVLYQGELGLLQSTSRKDLRGLDLLRQAIETCTGLLDVSNPHCLAMQAKLVHAAQQLGLYVLAREQADRVLKASRASLPEGHPLAKEVEQLRALLRVKSAVLDGRVEEYEALLKEARKRHRRDFALMNHAWFLAGAYHSQGRLSAALPLMQEALAEAHRRLGPEDRLVVELEGELAVLLLELGRPFEAVPLFEHVCGTLLQQKGEASADTLIATSGLGHALFLAGQLDRARSVLEAGLALARERLGASHEASLSLINNLGLVMSGLGQIERAHALYTEALESLRLVGKDEDEDGLRARHNLAQALRELGRLSEAEVHQRVALDGRTRLLGRAHPATLYSLHGLGMVQFERGHLGEARLLLEEALRLRRETLGERHPETLNSVASQALLNAELGDAAAALRDAELAWRLTCEVLGRDHPRSLELQDSLAGLQVEADPAHDRRPLRQALEASERVLGPQHLAVLLQRYELALLELFYGSPQDGLSSLCEAYAAMCAGLGANHPVRLQRGVELGFFLVAYGKLREARELLEGLLPGLKETFGPDDGHTLLAREALFEIALRTDPGPSVWGAVREVFQLRMDRLEQLLWAADEETRAPLLEAGSTFLEVLVRSTVQRGGPEAGRLVLEAAFASKGLGLRVASRVAALRRAQDDPALAGQARELAELRRELGERLAAGPRGEPLADFEARLEALRSGVREREVRLARSVAGLRQAGERPSFDAVAARLGKEEALVEYLVFRPLTADMRFGPERLAAAVLAPGASPEAGLVDLGPLAEVSERTQVLRGLLGLPDLSAPVNHLEEQSRRLHALLWEPLAPWLRGHTRVWVVPEGPLNLLPFAALRGPDGRFLVQDVELGLLGSSRELLPRPLSAPAPAAGEALVLAGPDYGPVGPAETSGVSELAGLQFGALAGAADEGAQVAELLKARGRKVSLLRGAEASEGALRRARRPELVHLATHGFYLDASGPARPSTAAGGELVAGLRGLTLAPRPAAGEASPSASPAGPRRDPLVRSGLALAAANRGVQGEHQADGNDGLLLALEALDLELQGCRLVVLSACETGLGDVRRGEGVQGLRRAFLEAGAQAVLSTLWQVSDEGTRAFMLSFYGHLLAGEPAPRALTLTQRELLRDAKLSHPFFWAPFLVVGPGR